jgi:hypothetical protein
MLPHWAAIGQQFSWRWLQFRSQANFRKTMIAGLVVLTALTLSPPVQCLMRKGPRPLNTSLFGATPWQLAAELSLPADVEPRPLPALAKELKAGYPNGKLTGPILCSETTGEYLIWAMPPDQPPLAFTHVHLFTGDYWSEFLRARNGGPNWKEFLAKYGANLVVMEPDVFPGLPEILRKDPEWVVILDEAGNQAKTDPRARLFIALRRKPIPGSSH